MKKRSHRHLEAGGCGSRNSHAGSDHQMNKDGEQDSQYRMNTADQIGESIVPGHSHDRQDRQQDSCQT